MSPRPLPATVRPVARYLDAVHGRHLQNAVRAAGVTCSVCTKPLNHSLDRVCAECQGHIRSGEPLADRVGLLIYAEKYDSQSYKVVRQYKGPNPGPEVQRVMKSLIALGLRGHSECATQLSGTTTGWAVMPSSQDRTRLGEIVRGMARKADGEVRLSIASDFERRRLRPENFVVESNQVPEHVLLVDDSWVSGSNAQSAAGALKHAGARDVSVFVVARVLDPEYPATKRFLASRGRPSFDPERCPWTGDTCP